MKFALMLLIFLGFTYQVQADVCADWFKSLRLKPGKGCLLKCVASKIDMSSFDCHGRCAELCKEGVGKEFLFQLSSLYPGLTLAERAIAAQYPDRAIKTYKLALNAEKICAGLYPTPAMNDESDACRHFVWAGLVLNEYDRDFAEKVLHAHEQSPGQPEAEKAMDLANNQLGLSSAEKLKREKAFTEEAHVENFQKLLDSGTIVVLKRTSQAGGLK